MNWDYKKDEWERGYVEGVYITIKSMIDVANEHNHDGIDMYNLKRLMIAFLSKHGDKLDRRSN